MEPLSPELHVIGEIIAPEKHRIYDSFIDSERMVRFKWYQELLVRLFKIPAKREYFYLVTVVGIIKDGGIGDVYIDNYGNRWLFYSKITDTASQLQSCGAIPKLIQINSLQILFKQHREGDTK